MAGEPIIVERTLNAPPEKVWKAITDRNQMKSWYFDLADFKPKVGFEFRFTGGTETKKLLHICRITEVIPQNKLSHSWRYDGYEGLSTVTFELFNEGKQTRVRLTHTGVETFPQATGDFARENFVQGWTHIIGTSLKGYVEGTAAHEPSR
jgi:uncharacterized protein YndB with AHSA1/START domain